LLKKISTELANYRIYVVRWYKGGSKSAGDYTIFYGSRSMNHELGAADFAVKRGEIFIDKKSYIILRGCWCDVILNVHAPVNERLTIQRIISMGNYSLYLISSLSVT
jgi:hypothetical protein